MILILLAHPSKGIQKNMLKAWNFNKYKLCKRSFDNNLPKNYSSEQHRTDTFDKCLNGRLILRQLSDINLKMIPFLLAVEGNLW